VEVGLLLLVGANLTEIALVLFGLQLVCAGIVLGLSLRTPSPQRLAVHA
jgi:hypothetical protein